MKKMSQYQFKKYEKIHPFERLSAKTLDVLKENGYKINFNELKIKKTLTYDVMLNSGVEMLFNYNFDETTIRALEKRLKDTPNCEICGIRLLYSTALEIAYTHYIAESNFAYVTTIDNSKIVNLKNIQIICKRCVGMKQGRTIKELVLYCRNVLVRHNKPFKQNLLYEASDKNNSMPKNVYEIWAKGTISNHRRRGFSIEFSNGWLEELARNTHNCNLCGQRLDWSTNKGKSKSSSPTLDRVNNENVLAKRNVQILCRLCNVTKQDWTMQQFLDLCKIIIVKFGELSNPCF